MKLTKNQQFLIVSVASQLGINPSLFNFDCEESKGEDGVFYEKTLITVHGTECHFKIWGTYRPLWGSLSLRLEIRYSPSSSTPFSTTAIFAPTYNSFDWKKLLEVIEIWLKCVKVEIDAINYFENSVVVPIIPDTAFSFNQNEPLDEQAQTIFADKLEDLKEAILQEIKLSREDAELIRQKMDELILKVDRLNKFDLKTQFYGLMTNLASSILYDQAGKFWEIFKFIFNNMALPKG